VSTPKVPPEIAKKIAAMAKPAAPAAPRPAAAAPRAAPGAPAAKAPPVRPAAGEPAPPLGLAAKAAIAGWVVAVLAGVGAYYFHASAASDRQAALAEQAATYDARIAQLKTEAAAALQKVQDDATASLQVLQTELDFQKMPELPLETTFRANQVLYIESRLDEPFSCKVRLFRPIGQVSHEIDYTIKARTFQDVAALDTWVFAKGDQIEFVKPGFKPRALVVP
jgi:hypothetical protein